MIGGSVMAQRFAGKVALVTGGGTGIGRATARALAQEGATVVVAGRSQDTLAETVKLIQADGGRATLAVGLDELDGLGEGVDRKSTRLNSSHLVISYAVFCLKKKTA